MRFPSITAGVRWTSDSGKDDINVVADAINGGQWGYNNLQWYGLTYYHKFNDQWHIAFESYTLHENNVPNALNPAVTGPAGLWTLGGTPFSPQYMPFNAPGLAQCSSTTVLACTAAVRTDVTYLNYRPGPLDNISYRLEYYDDMQGQRTGTKTAYFETGVGWQHWFSPQIEIRPEFTYLQVAERLRLQRQRQPRHPRHPKLCPHRCGRHHPPLLRRSRVTAKAVTPFTGNNSTGANK